MLAKDLLEYTPEQLEALTDDQLTELFKQYFNITRPEKSVEVKNKVASTLTGGKDRQKKAAPDMMANLSKMLSPEQMKQLQTLAAAKKKWYAYTN